MNSILSKIFIFAAGAAIGSVVTYKFMEKKCNDRFDEEVEKQLKSERDHFEKQLHNKEKEVRYERERRAYSELLYKNGYYDSSENDDEEKQEDENMDEPYVISPDELGDCDYEIVSLTFYQDNTLADELGNIIEGDELEETVGGRSLTQFGEYEDDSVFVRNDRLQTDYEIQLDMINYSDAWGEQE